MIWSNGISFWLPLIRLWNFCSADFNAFSLCHCLWVCENVRQNRNIIDFTVHCICYKRWARLLCVWGIRDENQPKIKRTLNTQSKSQCVLPKCRTNKWRKKKRTNKERAVKIPNACRWFNFKSFNVKCMGSTGRQLPLFFSFYWWLRGPKTIGWQTHN